jgi:hemerythrin-like domain-containing protein
MEAKNAVVAGEKDRLRDVLDAMNQLIEFYPQHIEKEDKHFFPDTERHYTKGELDEMIHSFYTFDMRMIHEKYAGVVGAMEEGS